MTEEPKMAAGPVTVDQMVSDPVSIQRRAQKMLDERAFVSGLLPPAPPGPPRSRWWRWKRRTRQAMAGMRERAALRLAPWLDNYGEGR